MQQDFQEIPDANVSTNKFTIKWLKQVQITFSNILDAKIIIFAVKLWKMHFAYIFATKTEIMPYK